LGDDLDITLKGAAPVRGFLVRAGSFGITVLLWRWVAKSHSTPIVSGLLVVGAVVLVFPVVWLSRRLLDAQPTPEHTAKITALIHYVLMILFGTAIIEAVQTGQSWRGWAIPLPAEIGLELLRVTGLATILTVVNLAVRGLGGPFAIAPSRRLAMDWMYRWTRNPMVLATLVRRGQRCYRAVPTSRAHEDQQESNQTPPRSVQASIPPSCWRSPCFLRRRRFFGRGTPNCREIAS